MSTAITRPHATAAMPGRRIARTLAIACGTLALAFGGTAADAQSHGGFHGGGFHGGGFHGGGFHGGYYRGGWGGWPFWGVGVGLGLGLAGAYYYDQPNYVVVDGPPVYYGPPAQVVAYPSAQPAPAPAPAVAAPDPIFYPRNNQSVQQTEADRQACNRWATTQPRAMADASIFQRATLACMDGRGYTAR